jgi:predicted molibdopterin-dependent oxidoreductase YjgC
MATDMVQILADGRLVRAAAGTSVAAALLNLGITTFRVSVSGGQRGPVCGMGVCFECRVTIDGAPHQRACMVSVAEGMTVTTAAGAT